MRFFMLALLAACAACATSPTGRKQLMLVGEGQMDQMGLQAFQQIQQQTPTDPDPKLNAFVKCVAVPLTQQAQGQTDVKQWQIVVFKDPTANAFALPGGEIGVNDGIMKVVKSDAQLATVLAHEIGHVISKHGAERVSDQYGTEAALAAVGAITGSNPHAPQLMALLGTGAQVGVLLPFSRAQEAEADDVGLDLMARTGFDPRQAIELWKNMINAGGAAPPQWLSDHPADQNRINDLESRMPAALALYEQAQAAGKHPHCEY